MNEAQKLVTGQYYTSRLIQGPRALEAAADFVRLAKEQVDRDYPVREDGDGMGCSIDLEEWPDDEGFGEWFGEWAKRWDITVED